MVIAKVTVNASSAKTEFCGPLPIGGCGLQVQFVFDDPAWKQLSKTAVFRNRSKSYNAFLKNDCAVIPHELLTDVTDVLYAGVYGTDSKKSLIIPTVWARLGEISGSANPAANYTSDPTLPYWAQVKESVDILSSRALDQEDLENALNEAKASGEFNGPQGEQGEKGAKGDKGDPGPAGANGKDGYSPVAGVDYWTEADRESIIAQSLDQTVRIVRQSYDIIVSAGGKTLSLTDAAHRELKDLRLFGQTNQNGSPAANSPVALKSIGSDGYLTVTLWGKNLCSGIKSGAYLAASGIYESGLSVYNCTELIKIHPGTVYAQSNNLAANISDIHFFAEDGTWLGRYSSDSLNSRPEGAAFMAFNYFKAEGLTWVQVETGFVATPYEPCSPQRFTVSTLGGLHGIPVSSGGNHSDENSQMWICDVVDFGCSRYVQHIGCISSYAGEAVTGAFLSSTGALTTGATVLYALPQPIEKALPVDEVTAFSALRTTCPTTIYADNAPMVVKYVADPKQYIDTKLSQLTSAIIANV